MKTYFATIDVFNGGFSEKVVDEIALRDGTHKIRSCNIKRKRKRKYALNKELLGVCVCVPVDMDTWFVCPLIQYSERCCRKWIWCNKIRQLRRFTEHDWETIQYQSIEYSVNKVLSGQQITYHLDSDYHIVLFAMALDKWSDRFHWNQQRFLNIVRYLRIEQKNATIVVKGERKNSDLYG